MEISMSSLTLSAAEDVFAAEYKSYLGPATVLHCAPGRLKIELPAEQAWATSALPVPYQPVAGDIVLAIGHSGEWYVIGLLKGSGPTVLTVPGDFEVRAPRGRICLSASTGVELRSDEVRVTTRRLEMLAHTVFERFSDATRWVKGTFQLRSGRLRTRVEGTYDLGADRIVERASKDVKIDGTKIHLG
jgi:hypothetical protein